MGAHYYRIDNRKPSSDTWLTTERPNPSWLSSDWTANYETPSTYASTAQDHFIKRLYLRNSYKGGK